MTRKVIDRRGTSGLRVNVSHTKRMGRAKHAICISAAVISVFVAAAGLSATDGASVSVSAGPPSPFSLSDYQHVQKISQLSLSSDGAWVVFATMPLTTLTSHNDHVFVLSLVNGVTPRELRGLGDARAISWVPNSRKIAFLSSQDGGTSELSEYDVDTGKTSRLTRAGDPVISFKFAPDGKHFAYVTQPTAQPSRSLYQRFRSTELGIVVNPWDTSAHDFFYPDWNVMARTLPMTLWVGGDRKDVQVKPDGDLWDFSDYFWSPNSRNVTFTYVAHSVPDKPIMRREYNTLANFSLFAQRVTNLADASLNGQQTATYYSGGEWTPDGAKVLVRMFSDADPWTDPGFPKWALIDPTKPANLSKLRWTEMEAVSAVLSVTEHYFPKQTGFLYEGAFEGHQGLFEVDNKQHAPWDCTKGMTGASTQFHFDQSQSIVIFVNESMVRPQEVFVCDGRGKPRQLTYLNAVVAKKLRGQVREVSWTSADGTEAHGWLLVPTGAQKPWPLVTLLHGGPGYIVSDTFANYFNIWPYPFEVLATQGVATFLPNYRGTPSYGRRFLKPNHLDGQPVDDVVTGVASLVDSGIADPTRLGLTGQSHGAWLGPLVLTRAHIFRAASFANGGGDTVMTYEAMPGSLNKYNHDRTLGDGASLYDSQTPYLRMSANFHFAGVRTAVLSEAGAYNEPIDMLDIAKVAEHAGAPNEYVVYPQTFHNFSREDSEMDSARRNLAWFEFWLLDKATPDFKASAEYQSWLKMKSTWTAPIDSEVEFKTALKGWQPVR